MKGCDCRSCEDKKGKRKKHRVTARVKESRLDEVSKEICQCDILAVLRWPGGNDLCLWRDRVGWEHPQL